MLDTFRIDPPYNTVVPLNNNKDSNDAGLSQLFRVVSEFAYNYK